MGHDYYDKDAVFNSYIKDLALEETLEFDPPIEEGTLGQDIFDKVVQLHEQVTES